MEIQNIEGLLLDFICCWSTDYFTGQQQAGTAHCLQQRGVQNGMACRMGCSVTKKAPIRNQDAHYGTDECIASGHCISMQHKTKLSLCNGSSGKIHTKFIQVSLASWDCYSKVRH